MNRREAIKAMGLLTVATAGGGLLLRASQPHPEDPAFKTEFDLNNEALSFEEACGVARRMDSVSKFMDLDNWNLSTTYEDLIWWAKEAAVQIEYNGAITKARFPSDIGFFMPRSGREANHILGRSNCANYIVLNERMQNPHTPWFQMQDFPGTVIHEMAHVAQGEVCYAAPSENIENTAQLVMIEVLASMGNKGNAEAFKALVWEFKHMATTAAYSVALTENRMPEFEKFKLSLNPSAVDIAKWEAAKRTWADKQYELKDMLYKYNYMPVNLLVTGVRNGTNTIEGLALEPNYGDTGTFHYPGEPRSFKVDDFAYATTNCEALAREYVKGGA